ncbi:hypothetical protein I4F81_000097 [Pyropia yezoensis]|uniref:Uncharacterized protein n=1 Tax=Pyropia yezoensis TaxID=2788 RepID=A0ACC3BI87_PYRYE|nr:hypothetical protein I4F81_000097 [Neopyropia yezoensis]
MEAPAIDGATQPPPWTPAAERAATSLLSDAAVLLAAHPPQAVMDPADTDDDEEAAEWAARSAAATTRLNGAYAAHATVDASDVDGFEAAYPAAAAAFSFPLDDWQRRALAAVHHRHDILVAAPTGCGKTVVAEYAVDRALGAGRRALYTTPVKTLSNQKVRDFRRRYSDAAVGIVTGDRRERPGAPLVVMTAEVLRNSVVAGEDSWTRGVDVCILDEVHMLGDPGRGVVWEALLLHLPPYIPLVMLSATVGNAVEVAAWVGRSRGRHVRVVTTPTRVVPLEHTVAVVTDVGRTSPVRETVVATAGRRDLDCAAYRKAIARVVPRRGFRADYLPIARYLVLSHRSPALFFFFSHAAIHDAATSMGSLDFLARRPAARAAVHRAFAVAMSLLPPDGGPTDDLAVARESLLRGIGFHHAGLRPLLREVVESLFAAGAVPVLLATETFAVGVHAPARTVVFPAVTKFDGTAFRPLTAGEFAQMAGRAGRRGLDAAGTVTLAVPFGGWPPTAAVLGPLLGTPPAVTSAYRVTYGALLHHLRQGGGAGSTGLRAIVRRSLGALTGELLRDQAAALLPAAEMAAAATQIWGGGSGAADVGDLLAALDNLQLSGGTDPGGGLAALDAAALVAVLSSLVVQTRAAGGRRAAAGPQPYQGFLDDPDAPEGVTQRQVVAAVKTLAAAERDAPERFAALGDAKGGAFHVCSTRAAATGAPVLNFRLGTAISSWMGSRDVATVAAAAGQSYGDMVSNLCRTRELLREAVAVATAAAGTDVAPAAGTADALTAAWKQMESVGVASGVFGGSALEDLAIPDLADADVDGLAYVEDLATEEELLPEEDDCGDFLF